jgi:cytochrome b subunit of formate dehydrogenase
MMVLGVYHILWVWLTRRGHKLMSDLAPRPKDFRDLKDNVSWFLERSDKRPRFGRFSYAEKVEYWAVVWGMLLMGTTGLVIWWKLPVTQYVPRWVIDASVTIHFFEAILAVLAIIVWHFYHVIFDPDVYPANWSFLDGKVSKEWYAHEHPLDTTVKTEEPPPPSTDPNGEGAPTDNPPGGTPAP